MAVQVDIKSFVILLHHGRFRTVEQIIEIIPRLFCRIIPAGAFEEVAIGIEFGAVEPIDHQMRVTAEAIIHRLIDLACQLLRVRIVRVHRIAAGAVGYDIG